VHSPLGVRQPAHRTVKEIGPVHGVEALSADGNDIDVVWRLAEYGVGRARNEMQPVLLEFFTYRWKEHCGPREDLELGYRDQSELELWRSRCPIARFRKVLLTEKILKSDVDDRITRETVAEILAAFDFAKASPYPPKEDMMRFVFPEPVRPENYP